MVFSARRLIVLFAAVALLLPACTDSDPENPDRSTETVSAGAFMDDVCTAMSDWLADFLAGYQEVRSLDPDASVQQGKETLDRFLTEAIASTDQLQAALRDAGVPDVERGVDFADGLTSALERAKTALQDARDQLAGMPNDPTKFRKAAIALGDTVRQQLASAGDAIGEDVPALQEAAADTPSCQSLGGTVGAPGT